MTTERTEEKKYYERLGIIPTSIDNIKNIIKQNIKNTLQCWQDGLNVDRQTFRIIGEAGIGKTAISLQLADELTKEVGIKFDSIIIKGPVLSRDDLLCPFPDKNSDNSRFKMLYSDFIPLDPDSYGIYIIDELSRADYSFQQLCWQIENEQRIHTQDLPKGWFVICIDNPDDKEYSMNIIEDAAGLRRQLQLYSEVNVKAFLKYAVLQKFHPYVIEWIEIHPDYLYDFSSQKAGMVYANPASWERVSNILWGFEKSGTIENNLESISILLTGLLNQNMSRMLINFLKDRRDISPRDIYYRYSDVRKDILEFVNKGENSKIAQIVNSFTSFLLVETPVYSSIELKNIGMFLTDIPSDIAVTFVSKIHGMDIVSKEYKYITKIHSTLTAEDETYRTNFFESLLNINKQAKQKT